MLIIRVTREPATTVFVRSSIEVDLRGYPPSDLKCNYSIRESTHRVLAQEAKDQDLENQSRVERAPMEFMHHFGGTGVDHPFMRYFFGR